MKPTLLDVKWGKEIRQEYQRMQEDEDLVHNKALHLRILKTWERDSPKMWARLQALKVAEEMAFVSQERMWQTARLYREGGMPVTDAREQAEKEHLMLEPEEPEQDDSDLPEALQDGPQYLKDRWRAEQQRLSEPEF